MQGGSPPDVVVTIHALVPGSESFRQVIADAVQYRLGGLGLVLSMLPDTPLAGADASAIARNIGAAIVLACSYSAGDADMVITFEWRDLQQGKPTVSHRETGPLDLTLDTMILKALNTVLASVRERVDQLAASRKEASAAAAAAAQETAGTTTTQGSAAEGSQVTATTGTAATTTTTVAPPSTGGPPSVSEVGMRFVLSSGVAAFVPIGPASSYFAVGVAPYFLAGLDFPAPPGRFAIGLYAGANIFSAAGPADTATGFLIPFGPDASYKIGNGEPFLAFAHVSGGPALLVLGTAAQGTLVGLTGYLKSGFGAAFMFSPRFGLEFIIDYEVYFEMPYLIMGVSPTLSVSFAP